MSLHMHLKRGPVGRKASVAIARASSNGTSRSNLSLEQWIPGPLEIAAFVPRLTVGALLSAGDKLPLIQPRLQKLVELTSDNTLTMEEKQAQVLSVVESDLLEFLEKGAGVESDVLQQLKAVLPENILQQIPVPAAPTRVAADDFSPYEPSDFSSTQFATSEVTDLDESPPPMPTQDAQTAAALVELRSAVTAVQSCITQFAENQDATRTTMLRINIQEARDRLKMRIQEIEGSATSAPGLETAIAEAKELLTDVSSQL